MRPRSRVIQVIETISTRGEGTPESVFRRVTSYYDFDGNLLAEDDPAPDGRDRMAEVKP